MGSDRADLVVVGAGTVGGWSSYFAASQGAGRVVVVERGLAGVGASSRAAGMVRAQGGTPTTVALGRWSIDFYRGQQARLGTDSGFRELGYLIFASTHDEARVGRERVAMQQAAGVDARWLEPDEAAKHNPELALDSFVGASYLATDGCIDPPRNVLAYSLAMQRAGVELREHVTFIGLRTERTATGAATSGLETRTESPWMTAEAQWNFRSASATAKPRRTPSLASSPPPVFVNRTLILLPSTVMDWYNGPE